MILFHKGQFTLCTLESLWRIQCLYHAGSSLRNQIGNLFSMFKHFLGTAQSIYQTLGATMPYTRTLRQRNAVIRFHSFIVLL